MENEETEGSYQLQLVNNDTLAIIQDFKLVKLLYRNQQSQSFEVDECPRVFTKEASAFLIALTFTEREIKLLS